MTDAMVTGIPHFAAPRLRVSATYAATDGRVPEEITIEFGGDGPVDPGLVDRAVAALGRVAIVRDVVTMHGGYRVTADALDTAADEAAARGDLVDLAAVQADVNRRARENAGVPR